MPLKPHVGLAPPETERPDPVMSDPEPKRKKLKASILSEAITTEAFQSLLRTHWQGSSSLETPSLEVITSPFRVCKISNFLRSSSFLEDLTNELSAIETRRPDTDLYSFEQTSDLANADTDNIQQIHQLFQHELRNWMQRNLGIELNTTISMSSSAYSATDYLLCHDDNLGDRRIAFILYLSKSWTAEDGGSLDLFDTDPSGRPRNIIRSLVPEYNSLVFFEVTNNSYHQVAEVTSPDKRRLTIGGWFHGPLGSSTRPPRSEIEPLKKYEPSPTPEDLSSWVMEDYLKKDIKKGIQLEVEKKSYMYLTNFFHEEVYNKISAEMMSERIKWTKVGPPDSRNYEVADEESLPAALKQFYELFKSIEMFKLLKDYTELDLVPDGKNMEPKMTIQLQRWSKGCYTLLQDKDKAEDDESYLKDHSDIEQALAEGKNHTKGLETSENEDSDGENDKLMRTETKGRKLDEPNCSTTGEDTEGRGDRSSPDSTDSPSDLFGSEESGDDSDDSSSDFGSLDVIMQFNTSRVPEDVTIDYVDPYEPDGVIIYVPPEDNHLFLVYRKASVSRVQQYVNHHCEGYFYNLICSYVEKDTSPSPEKEPEGSGTE